MSEELTPGQIADMEAHNRAIKTLEPASNTKAPPPQITLPLHAVTATPDVPTRKKYTTRSNEEKIAVVRGIDALTTAENNPITLTAACKQYNIPTTQYHNWKQAFGLNLSGTDYTKKTEFKPTLPESKLPAPVVLAAGEPVDHKTTMMNAFDAAVQSEVEKQLRVRLKGIEARFTRFMEMAHDEMNSLLENLAQ